MENFQVQFRSRMSGEEDTWINVVGGPHKTAKDAFRHLRGLRVQQHGIVLRVVKVVTTVTELQEPPIARISYAIETDYDITRHDVAVYTEEAIDRVVTDLRRDYQDVTVNRLPELS